MYIFNIPKLIKRNTMSMERSLGKQKAYNSVPVLLSARYTILAQHLVQKAICLDGGTFVASEQKTHNVKRNIVEA